MSKQRRIYVLGLTLILVITLVLVSSIGCWGSPLIDIVIENQTDQELTIYFAGGGSSLGDIAPGEQINFKVNMDFGKYPITAKNTEGEIVFSETYTFMPDDEYHLIKTDEKHEGVVKVYKAVIPPLTTAPESSDNVTGK